MDLVSKRTYRLSEKLRIPVFATESKASSRLGALQRVLIVADEPGKLKVLGRSAEKELYTGELTVRKRAGWLKRRLLNTQLRKALLETYKDESNRRATR